MSPQAIPAQIRRAYSDGLLAARAEAARLRQPLLDEHALRAMFDVLYREAIKPLMEEAEELRADLERARPKDACLCGDRASAHQGIGERPCRACPCPRFVEPPEREPRPQWSDCATCNGRIHRVPNGTSAEWIHRDPPADDHQAVPASPPPFEPEWLVWSNHLGMWWRPDGNGYTSHVHEAGRYTTAAAAAAVRSRSWASAATTPPEVMVMAPTAEEQLAGHLLAERLREQIAAETDLVLRLRPSLIRPQTCFRWRMDIYLDGCWREWKVSFGDATRATAEQYADYLVDTHTLYINAPWRIELWPDSGRFFRHTAIARRRGVPGHYKGELPPADPELNTPAPAGP